MKRLLVAVASSFAFLLLFPEPIFALTVTGGQSIQSAINSAVSGQIITVSAGTYNERLNLSKTGIAITTNGKVSVKAISVTGNNNSVSGFTISDAAADAGITVKGNGNLIENNEIFHTGQDGIWFFGSNNIFRGNYVHDILDSSIGGDPHTDCFQTWGWNWNTGNTLFERNICNHTRTSGSNQILMLENQSSYPMSNITFRNNLFIIHDAGYSPLRFNQKSGQPQISNMNVINNTFYNTTGSGDAAVSMSNITNGKVVNNVSIGFSKLLDASGGSITQSNNASSGNYGMVNYGNFDFHLTAGSALINAGTNAGVTDDFEGKPRPQGGGYDIGAFEYGGPVSLPKAGDANGDGKIDIVDIGIIIDNYARSPITDPKADVNRDGKVDIVDIGITIDNYGK